jgi:hypothetical protein
MIYDIQHLIQKKKTMIYDIQHLIQKKNYDL